MARPTQQTINSGEQAWDAKVNAMFTALLSAPIPFWLHTGTEANLQATFPANQYDKCLVWVNHTVRGNTLYVSNGSVWSIIREVFPFVVNTSATMTVTEHDVVRIDGTGAVTINLPAVASNNGRTIRLIKTGASGTITIDPSGGELINGAATLAFATQFQQVFAFCDGTQWLAKL